MRSVFPAPARSLHDALLRCAVRWHGSEAPDSGAMAPKKRQRATPEAVVAVPAATTLTLKATSASADHLRESLTDMWRSEILCDVEFTIEGRSFKAHRNIVAAESPYLNALVTNTTMKERSGPIELKEIAGNTFASALEFMYSHETKLASQDDLQPLLHAASLLGVPSLEAAVEAAIAERLEPSSALHALGLAEHLSLPVLAAAAKEIVLAHFEEAVAVEADVLATLSAEKLGELIAADALIVRCVPLEGINHACPYLVPPVPPPAFRLPIRLPFRLSAGLLLPRLTVTNGWSSRLSRRGSCRRKRHLPRRHAACSATCASPAWPRNASCNWRRTS